jgi:hypothetical protein
VAHLLLRGVIERALLSRADEVQRWLCTLISIFRVGAPSTLEVGANLLGGEGKISVRSADLGVNTSYSYKASAGRTKSYKHLRVR